MSNEITADMQVIVEITQNRGKIEGAVDKNKDKLLTNACAYVRAMTPDNQEAFLYRTVTELLDDNLKDVFKTPEGRLSIFRIIEETMATGLELGKHAYAVPQPIKRGDKWIKKARYDIKRQGYHALLCGGDRPIFKDLRWGAVYEAEKDTCTVNEATGEVSHPVVVGKTRGEIIGVWVQGIIILDKQETKKEATYYPIDAILNIRDTHSEMWDKYKSGPWKDDLVPMAEKTAIKAFCRPYADVKDALAHAIYSEGGESFPSEQDEKPREDIADAILDDALDAAPAMGSGEQKEKDHQPVEDVTDEIAALEKGKEGKKDGGTLF